MARILVVDDESLIRVLVADVGESLGHEVLTAAPIKEGQDLAQRGVDIVLLDVLLPDGDGLAHVETFSQLPGRPDVIIITGHGNADAAEAALRSGAWEYLVKPLRVRDLSKALTQAVQWRNSRDSQSRSLLRHPDIIGKSPALAEALEALREAAASNVNVLITGETGTGKELFASALHANSQRAEKPFVPINCGAIPKDLLESELFGHEKGTFTHAIRSRPGRFEMGDGGTVFLDEIGEMDLSLQVKILRVLQEKEIERVGGTGSKKVDVRIVAATNRDLEAEVAAGRFREDLYYRLNVIPLHLPPLRERGGDVLLLARHFLNHFCAKKGRPPLGLSPDARRVLVAYAWPGNVRELENFMERLSILVDGDTVFPDDLPRKILDQVGDIAALPEPVEEAAPSASPAVPAVSRDVRTGAPTPAGTGAFVWPDLAVLSDQGLNLKDFLDAVEGRLIDEALGSAQGVKNQAAELLGIKRTTLIEKLKKRQA